MNRQITQLFGLAAVLFAVLIAFTSRWTVFEAKSLADQPSNRRALIEEQRTPRGFIYASDGRTKLAENVAHGSGQNRTYTRTYPSAPMFSQTLGYSFIQNGRRGLELSRNDDLAGREDEFESIISGFEASRKEGFDVYTNLDMDGQKAAMAGLAGRKGGVVAIEPATGKVRVMASYPDFDANRIPDDFRAINADPNKPLFNRDTQEAYPPGSTFKTVTATAALDSGKYKPDSIVDGSSPKTISGTPLENSGGEDFGPITLTDALTNSVNTVWAQVGESIGRQTLLEYMDRFGFNEDPKLDYPDTQMLASGIRNAKGRLVGANSGFDVGRVAIGQGGAEGQILATPLQMAEVAATIGNDGKLMKPQLTDKIVRKDGRVKERIRPDEQSQVMKPETAHELAAMMAQVVKEGTGTAAALEGIDVAGKTGTAEIANRTANQAWFICFAPVDSPRMAVAVTIENTQGQGGTEAAPIAKSVLEALLR